MTTWDFDLFSLFLLDFFFFLFLFLLLLRLWLILAFLSLLGFFKGFETLGLGFLCRLALFLLFLSSTIFP